jgi:hypothetical protein
MAIWLGKQILGQRDRLDTTLGTPPGEAFRIEAEVNDRKQAILLQLHDLQPRIDGMPVSPKTGCTSGYTRS